MTIVAAGILMFNEKAVFLARETYDGKFSGFGGRREKGESVKHAAGREFYEETMGLYGSMTDIMKKIEFLKYTDTEIGKGRYFRTFMLWTPVSAKMSKDFSARYNNLKKTKVPKQFLEKDFAVWVNWNDLNKIPIRKSALKTLEKIKKKVFYSSSES